jgi:hypothetical protein
MPDGRSSNLKPNRFSGFHLIATSIAALAGVGLGAYQTLMPSAPVAAPPVQVTVALEKPAAVASATETMVAKGDAEVSRLNLAQTASFTAALGDGADQRYAFASLFDGNPNTSVNVGNGDSEINILVSFAGGDAKPVTSIEYLPPTGQGATATTMDVMLLPSGQIDASGQPIHSFTLPQTLGTQSFALPVNASGKALWIRIAGQGSFTIGDLRILAAE